MFKNYFKTAFRNLSRNKVYAFINIAGLSIGLACAMLIMLYVKDEVSFDRVHKNVKSIYRIVSTEKGNGKENKNPHTGFLQGPRFTKNVTGIKSFVRVEDGREDIKIGTEVQSQNLLYVDSSFFSVFTFPLINGDAKTCLTEPHSIVLSEDAAKTHFGTTDAVGKTVMLKENNAFVPYKVTAVAKRCPQNSSIQFDVLMPFEESDADATNNDNWFNSNLNTFVVLDDKASMQTVEKQMQSFYVADSKRAFNEMNKEHGNVLSVSTYYLQPYLDMHLSTDLPAQNGLTNASNPIYSYILTGIALFVLLIACINFINLSVARSVRRAKEVGIRKIVGGGRRQLIMQFLGESFFLCTIAFVFAIVLVQLLLPLFNNLANKALALSYLFDAKLVAGYFILYIIAGLLAGFYPALILSGYNPVQTLYSRFQIAGKNYLQKSLVVLQFTLASFLIIATFIIYTQFNFLTKTDLGYDDNNLVIVKNVNLEHTNAAVFKNELMKSPGIAGVGANYQGRWRAIIASVADSIKYEYEIVDEDYFPLLKIPLVAGRNFSTAYPSDSSQAVIVNESYVKAKNWETPIDKTVKFNDKIYHVIGVVKDYHFASLSEKIMPQLFTMGNGKSNGTYYIKIKPNSAAESLKWIEKVFTKFYPTNPYSYTFENEKNIKAYESVAKWKQIILFAAILTIFISCIGLFGLSVLSAEKRTKEIGIRKVLGASVQNIVTTLSTDFVKLVVIALIIASALAYMAANKWLQNFPYRITISWWLFAIAACMVLMIALATVSFQAIKAALANPVKSLRTE
jgi:putative ABC transport system permease protein